MRRQHVHAGAALVLVLWLVASLSLIVLASARGLRQQTQTVGWVLARMRAESVLDAALALTAQRLVADKPLGAAYRVDTMALGEQLVSVEITPSSGLVDVNVAGDALLGGLLEKIGGLSPGDATVLVSRIRDYLDPDDIPAGVGGAEAAQYRAAGWPAIPRNSAMEDLAELRSVLGMTAALYERIAPYLGINGQQTIDIAAAPPALIDALTGQSGLGARIQAMAPEMRAGQLLSGATAPFFSTAAAADGQTVRLTAQVQDAQGHRWQRQTWLDLGVRPDSLTPWTVLSLSPTRRAEGAEQENRR